MLDSCTIILFAQNLYISASFSHSDWHINPKIPSLGTVPPTPCPIVTFPLKAANIKPPPITASFLFLLASMSQGTIQHRPSSFSGILPLVPSPGLPWTGDAVSQHGRSNTGKIRIIGQQ